MSVVFAQEQDLSVEDYVSVLGETSMRDRRPVANAARIGAMLAGSNFIVTARDDGAILGLARCMSDGAWICYCCDLAVKESAQGRGVGAGIIRKINELLGPQIGLVLVSYPESASFYHRLGMEPAQAFYRPRADAK